MSIRNKIKYYLLLISFLSISFPVQEFFHDHHLVEECVNLEDQHTESSHLDSLGDVCNHKTHFSSEKEQDFCFFIHISKSFVSNLFYQVYFTVSYLKGVLCSFYSKVDVSKLTTYYLRGPPFFYYI